MPKPAENRCSGIAYGHLVLSTLHTNTAVGAITRLQDMGVEPSCSLPV
ncbi:ATPase, T2SS/T4P/T4SS family [Shigella boydii]